MIDENFQQLMLARLERLTRRVNKLETELRRAYRVEDAALVWFNSSQGRGEINPMADLKEAILRNPRPGTADDE